MGADFKKYVAPSVYCLMGKGGQPAVLACLGCLSEPTYPRNVTIANNEIVTFQEKFKLDSVGVSQVCPTNATDSSTFIRDMDVCGDVCFPDDCESDVATAMLCVLGTQPTLVGGSIRGGYPNGGEADFKCPPVN